MSPEHRQAREQILSAASAVSGGDLARALGFLAGCVYELAFRIADNEGPPEPSRPVTGSRAEVLGSIVFQPASAILQKVAVYFTAEAKNFLKWKGDHVDVVRARMDDAAHQFGVELAEDVIAAEARAPECREEPVTNEEFDQVLFRRLVHEITDRVMRAQPFGAKRTVEIMFVALSWSLEGWADEHLNDAASMAFLLGKQLEKLGKRFQVGGYRAQAHWADDPNEAKRLAAIADRLEHEYSK
jgi:hypothetical protein